MRLLLLPISTRRALIYCQPPSLSLPNQQQSYVEKAVTWASKTWATWEKAESGWKLKTTQYGNKMLRRIPFEEWGLKSIPALREGRRKEYAEDPAKMAVEVRYPGMYQGLVRQSVQDALRALGNDRQGLHQKKMYYSVAAMPLTIPFAALPIIPNLPFFYLVFRAYSHYRALTGSRHLSHLVSANLLRPVPDATLDSLYSAGLLHASRADSRNSSDPTIDETKKITALIRRQMNGGSPLSAGSATDQPNATDIKAGTTAPKAGDEQQRPGGGEKQTGPEKGAGEEEEIMLLQGWNGKLIAERLDLPGLEIEIERAVEQVESQLNSSKKRPDEIREEKEEIETAFSGTRSSRSGSASSNVTSNTANKAAR